MRILGIKGHGIKKYQAGTQRGGIQPQSQEGIPKFQQPWQTLQVRKKNKDLITIIKERLYNNISPSGYYTPFKRVWNALINNTPEKFKTPIGGLTGRQLKQHPKEELQKLQTHDPSAEYFMHKGLENDLRNALWAKYLGLSDEQVGFKISDYIEESPYRPPHAKKEEVYYRINPKLVNILHQDQAIKVVPNKEQIPNPYKKPGSIIGFFQPDSITKEKYPQDESGYQVQSTTLGELPLGYKGLATGWGLGTYTVGTGQDDQGTYSSYYDEWDINPFKGGSAEINLPVISKIDDISLIGTPIRLYDRKYYNNQ